MTIKKPPVRVIHAFASGTMTIVDFVKEDNLTITVRDLENKELTRVLKGSKSEKIFASTVAAANWIIAERDAKKVKQKPIRPIMEDSRLWLKRKREMQEMYSPTLVNCSSCNSPRHQNYVCQYCARG